MVTFPLMNRVLFLAASMTVATALVGCDDLDTTKPVTVTIKGVDFSMDVAADEATRMKGLGDRESIAESGGMVFAFPTKQRRSFVMRDCKVDIDIMFLSDGGRILRMHEMKVEEARRADEPKPEKDTDPDAYETRLKRYNSDFECRLVVEIRGGRMKELGLKEGDQLKMPLSALKKAAK